MGNGAWQRDWASVWPAELRRDGWPLKAQTEAEAREAVGRAGAALERWRDDVLALGKTLEGYIMGAVAYGATPELPLS